MQTHYSTGAVHITNEILALNSAIVNAELAGWNHYANGLRAMLALAIRENTP